jgi:16S rRNA (uracil1498-N3)-methyltransferase
MKPRRGVLTPEQLDEVESGAHLPRATVHYLIDVLRLRSGDTVELSDGAGRLLAGRLERVSGEWRLTDSDRTTESSTSTAPITLLVGLIKPKRWRMVIEKAVELGVERLVPVLTQHVSWRPKPAELAKLLERWNRIALDTSKQCRRSVATRVEAPVELTDTLSRRLETNRLVAHLSAETTWPDDALSRLAPTALLVGPEGGLTTDEVDLALASGFTAVSLGGYPLRTETAVTALVALARDRLGFTDREIGVSSCP